MHLPHRLIITAFLISHLLLLAACSDHKQDKDKNKGKNVEVAVVERQAIKVTRILTGSLEAMQTVRIFNQEPGRIKQIHFYEGDTIEKDAILVELERDLIEAEFDKARASTRQAKLDLKRLKQLPSQLASQDQLARAQTAVDQAEAESRLQQTRLNFTQIRAPFAGTISAHFKEPGDVVPIHSHIMTIINPHALKARIYVSEILLGYLQKDAQLTLRIDALGDTQFPARILRVHPVVDPVTRQGVVEVQLNPVPEGALPGQLCRLYLSTETSPLRTIPLASLRHDAKGEYVYRVDQEGNSRYTRVKTGLQLNDRVEILEGLANGDLVIVKGIIGLRDGHKVLFNAPQAVKSPPPSVNTPQTNTPITHKGP